MYPMPFNNPHTYAGHGGIDYPQASGTPIRAIGDGVITYSGWWNQNAGNTRTLTLDSGLQSIHCHLVNLAGPSVGSRVRAGDVIGYVGTTGRSTGPHLHHELWLHGVKKPGAAYWAYIDRNRVVGAGSAAGSGGATPSPGSNGATTAPAPEEDDMNEDDRNMLKSIATKQGEIETRQIRMEQALIRDATLTGGSTGAKQTLFGLLRDLASAITRLAIVLGGSVTDGKLNGANVIDRLRSIEKKLDGKS